MPSQSMKEAANFLLHTCLPKPSPSQQEDGKSSSNLTSSSAQSRRFFASATATSFFPSTRFTSHESLPSLEDAFSQFIESYPHYSNSYQIDEIRGQEYYHLTLNNRVCLDYFGIGLFAFSQFHKQLPPSQSTASSSSPENQVQPNTSGSPLFSMLYRSVNLKLELLSSTHESKLESSVKKRIQDFLSISADDYCVVLTANRTAAFKLLAESYPFQSHKNLITVYDHYSEAVEAMTSNSVKRGAKTMAAQFTWPRLRIRSAKLKSMLVSSKTKKRKKGLFVFQLQSRVTGARYKYQWMQIAQENGWHVVLDACALGPKDMDSLGLSLLQPDFLISSFYKVFGDDPTGFGCLFVKKTAISILEDSKTASIVSIIPANRILHPVDDPSESETEEEPEHAPDISSNSWCAPQIVESEQINHTSNHQNKLAGNEFRCLDHVDSLGLTMINTRVRYLTNWLINALTKLYHPMSNSNSEKEIPLVRIYGPKIKFERGAAVAFNVFDREGGRIDPVLVQRLGDRKGITLGHGCLQNLWFEGKYEGDKGRTVEKRKQGESGVKVVTAAIGYLLNFQDVYRIWGFIAQLLDADFVDKERCRYTALTLTSQH